MLDIKSPVPLGHDGYFKLWTLEEKQLNYDCVYLDEAQDSNAPLLDILQRQRCQIVYVGDPYQSIYTFRGAINAMTEVQTSHEAALTTCFRFGQTIADAAFKVIRTIGADKPLQGHPQKTSRLAAVAEPDCIITRTNFAVFSELARREDTVRECCIGKKQREELLESLKDVKQLKQGRRGAYTEALRGYNSWEDVQEHVKNGGDSQLTSFFNLVERFSEDRLKYLVERTARTSKDARLSLTTAHRSKGQQWDRVLISDDFSEKVEAPSRNSNNQNSKRSSRE